MAKVISFSLWGNKPKYCVGAIRNAELAPEIYPGWLCYFQLDYSVPQAIEEKLQEMEHVRVSRRLDHATHGVAVGDLDQIGHVQGSVPLQVECSSITSLQIIISGKLRIYITGTIGPYIGSLFRNAIGFFFLISTGVAQPRFHALVLFENGGHHLEFTNAAQPWLNKLAADSNFTIDYIKKTDSINEAFLAKYIAVSPSMLRVI